MQLNAAKTDAPITAPPAEAAAPGTESVTATATDKPKRARKEDLLSRKNRNVPAHLLTMNIPFDYSRSEAVALAKVAHVLQKPEQLVLSDCLRWAVDQYMGTTFVPHIAAYDALPADQQTAKLPKETTARGSRSLSAKIATMTNSDDIRALLQKKREAAAKMQAEADAILAQMEAQANALLDAA